MRTVELIPGIRSSALGFGCAPILGAVDGKTAARALETALDLGVNHLDLARSYGYGEAERFVGRLLGTRRDKVVLASKFGIRATWRASLLRPLKPLVRVLRPPRSGASSSPPPATPSPSAPAKRDLFHERVPLRAADMRSSLERSLRALGTDHLDLFFVHEPKEGLPWIDELAEEAARLKQEGKIRSWGLAYDWADRAGLVNDLSRFDVLQFNNSPGAEHYPAALAEYASSPNVFFSPLRQRAGLPPGEALARLWQDFPRSVVLCSMFDPAHIRANAAAANA